MNAQPHPSSGPQPRPVFVVGKHRSGTTWLANQLCRHPDVAGVQHAAHAGIIESLYFSHVQGRFGDLQHWANFAELVEVLSASTYLQVTGISKQWLYELWPTDYAGFFRRVMDEFAGRRDAHVWVEKSPSHTLYLDLIASTYPDARFVGIVRSRHDVIASAVTRWQGRDRGWTTMHAGLRETGSWYLYNRALLEFARGNPRIRVIRYEDMLNDVERTMAAVCEFVDLPYDSAVASSEYAPNTSYVGRPRVDPRSRTEHLLQRVASAALGILPDPAYSIVRRSRRSQAEAPLPDWFFSLARNGAAPAEQRTDR